jgi:hypothetical protein
MYKIRLVLFYLCYIWLKGHIKLEHLYLALVYRRAINNG